MSAISNVVGWVQAHPVESATAGAVILGYLAKWTANAKTKAGKAIHRAAVAGSTKIAKRASK